MMELTHDQAREWMEKSLQTPLDPFEQAALESHLSTCADCARYRVESRTLDRRLTQSLPERWPAPRLTPADVESRLARIRSHVWRETMWKSISTAGRFAGAAALLIVIIVGLALLTRQVAPRPTPGGQVIPPAASEPAKVNPTAEPRVTPSALPGETATAAPTGGLSVAEAEKLVRDYEFARTPDMNPSATFPLSEITPPDVWQRMGAQLFKVTDGVRLAESYLIYQGQVAHLGNAFGGTGINSMVVTDLDQDGTPELVYAYNFGSGIHQSSVGMAWIQYNQLMVQDVADAQSIGDFNYRGDITLMSGDGSLLLQGQADAAQSSAQPVELGRLQIGNGRLLFVAGQGKLATYTSPRYGVSFQYPAEWNLGDGQIERVEGDGYFIELTTLENGTDDLGRACEWEANTPARYGAGPQIESASIGQHLVCLVHPSEGAGQAALVFQDRDGKLAILRVSPASLTLIARTLSFSWPEAQATEEPLTTTVSVTASSNAVTKPLGSLTLEEYAVVASSEDTPTHMEFNQRMPAEVFAKRAAWRDFTWQGRLDENNRQLVPYGYRLETKMTADGQDRAVLYQGDTLVISDLTYVFPVSAYHAEQGKGDFAMIVEESHSQYWLVRSGSKELWDFSEHGSTQPILTSGGQLIDMVRKAGVIGEGVMFDTVILRQDGQPFFTYVVMPNPVEEPVKGLWSWQGGWALEVNGTLIVNGANWNQKEIGAEEIFGFEMIDDKPFFFFRRDGKVSIWYDGQTLPVTYDDVIHYRCCEPGAFNPRTSTSMVAFYALRDGVWYYIELGNYQKP
jgi:hypothetical protein